MSSVILRTVKHRMAELMKRPGGPTVQEVLDRSGEALQAKAAPAHEAISARAAGLEAIAQAPDGGASALDAAYGLAGEIVNIAGCLDMPELFATAYGLCEVLDHFRTAPFNREAFEVHVRGLRLILTQAPSPALQGVVSGLEAVRERLLEGRLED